MQHVTAMPVMVFEQSTSLKVVLLSVVESSVRHVPFPYSVRVAKHATLVDCCNVLKAIIPTMEGVLLCPGKAHTLESFTVVFLSYLQQNYRVLLRYRLMSSTRGIMMGPVKDFGIKRYLLAAL
jgi:hypothetical protein